MVKGVGLWRGNNLRSKDFMYQDGIIREYVNRSGTGFNVHKYIGPYEQSPTDPTVSIPTDKNLTNELTVQDVVVLENRDRKYDTDIVELRGCYLIQDPGFDLSQFGIMLSGDAAMIEFHLNDHVEKLGRKLMAGDVIEPIHMRDYLPLDQAADPIPKYYVVQECMRPASGFGPTWFPHLWRAKCIPITDTQEFRDILHNPAGKTDTAETWKDMVGVQTVTGEGVDDLSGANPNAGAGSASSLEKDLQITRIVEGAAAEAVRKRSFYIRHFYMRPANQKLRDGLITWLMNDDNVPPNWTGDFIQSGTSFPESPADGDYFIRKDYDPETLFYRTENVWRIVQQNWRTEWVPASRILESYLRNNNITVVGLTDADTFPEQQPVSGLLRPQADILPNTKADDATGGPKIKK